MEIEIAAYSDKDKVYAVIPNGKNKKYCGSGGCDIAPALCIDPVYLREGG